MNGQFKRKYDEKEDIFTAQSQSISSQIAYYLQGR